MATTKITTSSFTGLNKYDIASADNNYMETIASTLVGAGGVSSITFNNIPQGYKHLQIRAFFLTSVADRSFRYTFNSDTGTNYASHYLRGNGATFAASGDASLAFGYLGATVNSTTYGSAFIIDILDYANTSKYKTSRCLSGGDANGSGYAQLYSSLWMNTAAINTINVYPNTGNFAQYSRFSLYGIKG
jgi:hypothetical protein